MWRKCDFHRHTQRDAGDTPLTPEAFIELCIDEGLAVVAVTDHDDFSQVALIQQAASGRNIEIIPGVEISTDRGHVLVLAPGSSVPGVLDEFCERVGLVPGSKVSFEHLAAAQSQSRRNSGGPFRDHLVMIGAHVDQDGSLFAAKQPMPPEEQIALAKRLQGLEVANRERLDEWNKSGVKQSKWTAALLRGSDAHGNEPHESRWTWVYLPEVSLPSLRHALATPEASLRYDGPVPAATEIWIKSIAFEGGKYAGRKIEFSPRSNAIIGPPSSGKSLIVDALRFAFGETCDVPEVARSAEQRLNGCLPQGASVIVEVMTANGVVAVRRVRGGAATPDVPFRPIIFSQTELTRRALDQTESIALLDIHCPEASRLKLDLVRVAGLIDEEFQRGMTLAAEAGPLRLKVTNAQDGLDVTHARFTELTVDDDMAKQVAEFASIVRWRQRVTDEHRLWRDTLVLPAVPQIPRAPDLITPESAGMMPDAVLQGLHGEFIAAVAVAADRLRDATAAALEASADQVMEWQRTIESLLGHALAEEIESEIAGLRRHLADLEEAQARLSNVDDEILSSLAHLKELIDESERARETLRTARKETCTRVNESMSSFFVRIRPNRHSDRLDALMGDLKTGTNFREETVRETSRLLNRKRLLESAIRHRQGLDAVADPDGEFGNQDRIATNAADRERGHDLAVVAGLWPGDGVEIAQLGAQGANPVGFGDLTEGLKALAIKEISFADSILPVVSDQPEDAVPTTQIYENLVPTLRSQRARRQFIVASHDTNVVVTADVECVIALPGGSVTDPTIGTLFDPVVRGLAMDLLEGGDSAFAHRRRRYGNAE